MEGRERRLVPLEGKMRSMVHWVIFSEAVGDAWAGLEAAIDLGNHRPNLPLFLNGLERLMVNRAKSSRLRIGDFLLVQLRLNNHLKLFLICRA